MTDSGKVATFDDETLSPVAFRLEQRATLFSELQGERIHSIHVCSVDSQVCMTAQVKRSSQPHRYNTSNDRAGMPPLHSPLLHKRKKTQRSDEDKNDEEGSGPSSTLYS